MSTPLMLNATTPSGCMPNCKLPRVRPGVRCGCCMEFSPRVPGPPRSLGGARARPTNLNTWVSPDAGSWSRASGPTSPSTTTELNVVNSFGNFSNNPVSSSPTPCKTGPTGGNVWPLTIPTFRPGPCCCCTPWPNDSDGKPNTPPPNWPPTDHHPTTTVRQLAIKPHEQGDDYDQRHPAAGAEFASGSPRAHGLD